MVESNLIFPSDRINALEHNCWIISSLWLDITKEVPSLSLMSLMVFSKFTIFGEKIIEKSAIFWPKIKNFENFCLRLKISFCTSGKVERGAITFVSYDIVAWNRVLVYSYFWIPKTRFFQHQKSGIFPLIQFMKVLVCCLKGQHPLTKIYYLKVCILSFL